MISREEVALRILCAQIISGKPLGAISIRESFALALTFEEHAKELPPQKPTRPPQSRLSFDDNGL